jgi:DNA-binding transcriptional regulator YhcF (GntR family)
MARNNQKGRGRERFVLLHASVKTSPAWRVLSPVARLVYLELLWRHRPNNNGEIPLSVREPAEELLVSKTTTSRAFHELRRWGFIELEQAGTMAGPEGKRRAARWRLTEFPTETRGATRDFEKLEAQAREYRAARKALGRVCSKVRTRPGSGTSASYRKDAD